MPERSADWIRQAERDLEAAEKMLEDELLDCARRLDRDYVPTRYLNSFDRGSPFEYYTREEAEGALVCVVCGRRIVRYCQGLLAGPAERVARDDERVVKVVLFGSLAEGRAVPGSDADVLVVLWEDDKPFFERLGEWGEVRRGLPVEVFPYTVEELDTPPARTALQKGVVLYARPAEPATKLVQDEGAEHDRVGAVGSRRMRRGPLEEGRRWLDQAKEDLHWARGARPVGRVSYRLLSGPAGRRKGAEGLPRARAHRPSYSVLACERLARLGLGPMRLWQEALVVSWEGAVFLGGRGSPSQVPLENWVRYWKSQFTRQHRDPAHRWQAGHWDTRLRGWERYAEEWEYVRGTRSVMSW